MLNDKAIKVFLENHANPNATNQRGQTALHNICSWNHEATHEIIQLLLKQNADINAVNQKGWTPLFEACSSGNMVAVECLLENHANPNVRNWMGRTALHCICSWNHGTTYEIIQLLLKNNVDIDATEDGGWTPLLRACSSGNMIAVKCLLENHANPNVRNWMGQTALHCICSWNHGTTHEIIQLLLKHNADIDSTLEGGWTPLFAACSSGNMVAVECLLENHANPNKMDRNGDTALHLICSQESEKTLQIIQLLLKHNADIEATEDGGWTPLLRACSSGNIVAVECLLENHANPNVMDRMGQTPLHLVCSSESQNVELIQLLLKHNADINAVNVRGETPLFEACIVQDIVAIKCLLKNHANPNIMDRNGDTALHCICSWNLEITHEIIQLMLKYNADIEAANEEGRTPLFKACRFGNMVAVECLLENHANPNATDQIGQTALHNICSWHYETTQEIIQLLLKYNADIEAVDREGRTPLFEAVDGEDVTPLFELLNRESPSPLFEASILEKNEVVKVLLRYGANVNILDKRNRSLLQCAIDKMLPNSSLHSNTVIKMLVSQIIKLKTAGLNVNACDFITINGVEYSTLDGLKSNAILDNIISTLKIKCEEEIEKMKMESIGIDDIFFYDLLTQHIHLLGILMENEKIQGILKPSIYDEKFPLYIDIIRFRLQDAQIRYRQYKLKKSANEYFSSNINQELPYECIDKVLDYLTVVDLKTFIRTFEPSRTE